MTQKISNSQLRKMVFDNVDENKNGKIENEETKLGAIFGLKDGDKKIKRKNFDRSIAEEFLKARNNGENVVYKGQVDDSAAIKKCLKCDLTEKDLGADIIGNNNSAIVQHGDNHVASKTVDGSESSMPNIQENDSVNGEIGLCVECDVEIIENDIHIEGTGNSIIYQTEDETIVIENNKEDIHLYKDNNVTVEECEDCTYKAENKHTTIKGNDNKLITQFGDNNKADLEN